MGDPRQRIPFEHRRRSREGSSSYRRDQGWEDRDGPQRFASVAENWFQRHVEAKGLRSKIETRRYLDKYILPAWGGRDFTSIRRGDVAKLLDEIEDTAGPVAADNALKRVSTVCSWYAARHEDYASPVIKGMKRSSTKERARDRILSDDEIRAVWKVAEANGSFGALVRLLLLTAQRREKVAAMRWQDISLDGTWAIPAEDREKGNAGELVLPEAALAIIRQQPRFAENPHVFAGRGGSHLSGYSKSKVSLDAKVAARSCLYLSGGSPTYGELLEASWRVSAFAPISPSAFSVIASAA
jgi:integrase